MLVIIGSDNPVKKQAVERAFGIFYKNVHIKDIAVSSQVSRQPHNEETFQGARNRVDTVRALAQQNGFKADFFVGIEGGIIRKYRRWFVFGVICICDNTGNIGFGTSPYFELPYHIVKQLKKSELGKVIDKMFGDKNTKRKGGAIGYFTKGVMKRSDFYVPGIVCALVPFLNKKIYFTS